MKNIPNSLIEAQKKGQETNERIALVLFANKDHECNEAIIDKYENIKRNN
jgi:hypothetical protein